MEQDKTDKRAVAPAQRPGDEMLPHVARFQAKGYTAAKIEAWLASYGLSNVDVPALMAKAADLSPEELRVKTAESRRITQFNAPFMALGSIVVTFLISWLIVGILAATTLGELILGGSVAAGLKIGDAIWGMVSGSKPVPVFVGSVLGFAAFLGSYIFIFEGAGRSHRCRPAPVRQRHIRYS